MKLSEYLTAARDILDQGWIQGEMENDDGCCMLWALNYVCWHPSDRHEVFEKALNAVACQIYESWPEFSTKKPVIADFNDAPGRTKDEVLNIFDMSIHSAQEHGE